MATLAAREAEERPQAEVARTVPGPSYAVTHSGYYNRLAVGELDTEENEMIAPKSSKASLKRLSQGAALCGAPVIGAGSAENMLGIPALGEALSLALLLGAFLGSGVWMFRHWGKPPTAQAPTETSPGTAAEPRLEREPVTA